MKAHRVKIPKTNEIFENNYLFTTFYSMIIVIFLTSFIRSNTKHVCKKKFHWADTGTIQPKYTHLIIVLVL